MYAVLLNPPKKRRKGKRRKSSVRRRLSRRCRSHIARRAAVKRFGKRAKKKAARRVRAKKSSGKIVRVKTEADPMGVLPAAYAANPRRRRRRRARNSSRRLLRRRRRNYSHWIPAYGESNGGMSANPAYFTPRYTMNNPATAISSVTAGFKPKVLMSTLPVVGGVVGNAVLSKFIGQYMPAVMRGGLGKIAVGLGSAGLLGAGAGLIKPKMAAPVFIGGVVETVTKAFRQYLLPMAGLSGLGMCCSMNGCGNCGLGDWGESMVGGSFYPSYQAATGLNYEIPGPGVGPDAPGPMGDFLTPQNAQSAQALGYWNNFHNDPIEATAGDELVAMGCCG